MHELSIVASLFEILEGMELLLDKIDLEI